MAADRPTVSRATRNALRRLMSSLYVGAIAEYWENENFARSEIVTPRPGGARQQTYDAYEASVDWSDQEHTRRALRVFESLLRRLDRDSRKFSSSGLDPTELEELREALDRDGYGLDDELRVRPAPVGGNLRRQQPSVPAGAHNITQVTRRRLFKFLQSREVQWFGDLDEIAFLRRLYDLDELPSSDDRFEDAEGDITQHRYNNYDWEDDWIYSDDRFGLRDGPDVVLLRFLSEMLHPEVRSDDAEAARLAELVESMVRRDGYTFAPVADISGYPIYGAHFLAGTTSDATPGNAPAQITPGRVTMPVDQIADAVWSRPDEEREPHQPGLKSQGPQALAHGGDTQASDLPAPVGDYAAVQSAARGQRKDYALERFPMKVGGQAEVFLATHKATGVPVALKRRLSWRQTPVARMRREIEVAQDLNAHPHYVPILDANPVEGWLVMPLAQGTAEEHRDELKDQAALLKLVDALLGVLEAAHDAHEQGWIHRDIKPSNILLLERRWRLGDWGVVRRPRGQTTSDRTRADVGTDGFAAPELAIDAHEATPAADIYGVGRVIAWALTGKQPVLAQRLLPGAGPWREIVRAATARDPRDRPQTIAELRQVIEEKLEGPVLTPAEHGARLLLEASSGAPEPMNALLSFIADHSEEQDLYTKTLTQLKPETAAESLLRLPAEAELLIEALSAHASARQRRIQYADAQRAILWLQRVAAFAASTASWDLMDEAARAMCVWDGIWDQYRAQDVISVWLRTLHGESAVLMAAALESHPDSAVHFRPLLNQQTLHRQLATAIGKATRAPGS
ncbi:protein kinase [Streptomyces sp. NPDC102467]|uniref:AbiJ-related protein n=1 Tax=Streptomyces sp. NPDC102467 TaxID=3366179 RepID=UPI0037FBFFB1